MWWLQLLLQYSTCKLVNCKLGTGRFFTCKSQRGELWFLRFVAITTNLVPSNWLKTFPNNYKQYKKNYQHIRTCILLTWKETRFYTLPDFKNMCPVRIVKVSNWTRFANILNIVAEKTRYAFLMDYTRPQVWVT